jgi:hypothetical protein
VASETLPVSWHLVRHDLLVAPLSAFGLPLVDLWATGLRSLGSRLLFILISIIAHGFCAIRRFFWLPHWWFLETVWRTAIFWNRSALISPRNGLLGYPF